MSILRPVGITCSSMNILPQILLSSRHHSVEAAKSLIDQAVKTSPLVLFMKGHPEQPMVSMIYSSFHVG
jgi:hypothetical protein